VTPIEVHDLSVSYQHRPVLWGIDCEFSPGKLTAVVGPNGAGKSTLLKGILGLVPLSSGFVKIFGQRLEQKKGLLTYVPQREEIDWDFPITVKDVVQMSHYGRLPFYKRLSRQDHEAVEAALEKADISALSDRQIGALSGGQQQRVFLARAIASDASIFLMDEPFSGVDVKTENSMLTVLKDLAASGRTIVCVHHDLNTVRKHFDEALLLNVRKVAFGPVAESLSHELVEKTYAARLGALTELGEALRSEEFVRRGDS